MKDETLFGGIDPANYSVFLGTGPMVDTREEDGEIVTETTEHNPKDVETRRKRVQLHFKRAEAFETSELPTIRRAFDAYEKAATPPDADGRPRTLLDAMIQLHGGDPVKRAEDALILRLSEGRGLYCAEATRRTLDRFKVELLGDNPTAIERVLVDSIACSWLDAMLTDERAAQATGGPKAIDFLDRRKERATRRLQRGLKALDLIRRKVVPGVAVQVNLSQPPPPASIEVAPAVPIPIPETSQEPAKSMA